MSSLCLSDGAVLPQLKRFCQRVGRRQMLSAGLCWLLATRLGTSQPMFRFQNRKVTFHIMQRILLDYLLAQGVDGARQLYDQRVFAKAGEFASVAFRSSSPFAHRFAKMLFREVSNHVFDALLGRLSPLTPAEAVVVYSNFHSPDMLLLGALAQLSGHRAPPGFPTPIQIMHRVPLQHGNPVSCFVRGLFLIRSGDLNGGIQLLDRCQFPEADLATVKASLESSFAGLDRSECATRLRRLIAMKFEPAKILYVQYILGRASGVPDITSELKELYSLFTPANMPPIRESLNKRLWATTARKRREAHRLRVRAQKARSEAIRLQRLNQSNPSDQNLKRAQKAEENALELERKADIASQEVEQNMSLVVEADQSIKEARAIATLKAREDAIAARARAKALKEEAKRAEKQAQDEAKRAEKRAREEAERAEREEAKRARDEVKQAEREEAKRARDEVKQAEREEAKRAKK